MKAWFAMRITTGFIFSFVFLAVFGFYFASTVQEAHSVQSISALMEEEINLEQLSMTKNSYIYDKNNQLTAELRNEVNRWYIQYEDIPKKVLEAFLATEDQNFYKHEGVDISAVIRALIHNAQSGGISEGASTITQQVVRNLFLSHEQTYDRKLSEALYAYQMEKEFSKEKILELYVNSIYFGNGIYGFETASRVYFGKSSSELTLAEITFLAAIPANPSHYDPLMKKENTLLRMDWILEKMSESGSISNENKEAALQKKISIGYPKKIYKYPDYVFYIKHELKELIALQEGYHESMKGADEKRQNQINKELNSRVEEVLKSGVHIETALDPTIQGQVSSAANSFLSNWGVQGAAVVIDHSSHEITAMSGGAHYKGEHFQRAFQAYRQPGSAIKPLLVFGPYLDSTEKGVESRISTERFCHNNYCPSNAGNGYYGSVSLSKAFAMSYNTAAIRLFHQTGIDNAFSYIEKFNFSKLNPRDYSYPAALGGFTRGISPLELTKAYTTLSNEGFYMRPRGIQRVTNNKGEILYEWPPHSKKIWEKDTNDKLRYLMTKVVTEGTGQKANITDQNIGGKTGTTNNTKDLWFVGYNDRFTTGVWIGHDIPAPLTRLHSPHLTLWKHIVSNLPQ